MLEFDGVQTIGGEERLRAAAAARLAGHACRKRARAACKTRTRAAQGVSGPVYRIWVMACPASWLKSENALFAARRGGSPRIAGDGEAGGMAAEREAALEITRLDVVPLIAYDA